MDLFEPELAVRVAQDVLEDLAGRAGHDGPARPGCGGVEAEGLLTSMDTVPRGLHQHRELGLVMSRADRSDDPPQPTALLHDLHRRRPESFLHPPDERHRARLPISAPDPDSVAR